MSSHKAILFDLDGTLVDTISLYEQAFIKVLAAQGYEVSLETFRDWYMRGVHLREIAQILGFPEEDIPQMRLERDAIYHELLGTQTAWIAGAEEALRKAKEIGPVGIVTGSWLSYLEAMRPKTDIFTHAKAIITADDMHMFMKPHPHGLLVCADRLGVDPAACVYIGDQKFDVEAANAAGMTSVLVHGTHTPKDAGDYANVVAHTLEEMWEKL